MELFNFRKKTGENTTCGNEKPALIETVSVYGSGCVNCRKLYETTKEVLKDARLSTQVMYITDYTIIAKKGYTYMPVLEVNGKAVSEGRIPNKKEIRKLLSLKE